MRERSPATIVDFSARRSELPPAETPGTRPVLGAGVANRRASRPARSPLDQPPRRRYAAASGALVGVFNGSIGYTRFHVRGDVPRRFQPTYMKTIRLRAFAPLAPDEEADTRTGWCAPGNVLDLELTQEKVFYDRFVTLGVRTDTWRIPRTLLRAHLDQASADFLARSGKERLSKGDREEIKFRVNKQLRRKVLPAMRLCDFAWDLDAKVLRFWSRSSRVKEEFTALFEATFGLRLDEGSPYVEASELLPAGAMSRLGKLEASSFLAL